MSAGTEMALVPLDQDDPDTHPTEASAVVHGPNRSSHSKMSSGLVMQCPFPASRE